MTPRQIAPIVRVLVLDASAQRRQRLVRLLEGDASLQVVDAVAQVDQALAAAARRQADVILIGQGAAPAEAVASTRTIMQSRATPVVVVTAASSPVEARQAFELMEAGALAVVRDPGPASLAQHPAALAGLRETVRTMAEVKVVRRWASAAAHSGPPAAPSGTAPARRATAHPPASAPAVRLEPVPPRGARGHVELVAIGASTGGPVALKELLCALPASFPAPIVIVQHMADGFLPGLAQWLSASCRLPTEVAGPDTVLQPGRAYLAPDGPHMKVGAGLELGFDAGPPVHGHRPAVSVLLASVAEHLGPHAIGILLTGMGKDGAAELKRMKEAGAITIAQDEASSVVHGMPGEAIRCGACTYVMSPQEIGTALPALAQR